MKTRRMIEFGAPFILMMVMWSTCAWWMYQELPSFIDNLLQISIAIKYF